MQLPLLVFVLSLFLAAGGKGGDKVVVHWQAKTGTSAALPEGFPEAARTALAVWEPFLKRAGYRVDADAGGRLLCCSAEDGGHAEGSMKLLSKVSAWFDGRFKPPAGPTTPASEPAAEPACATLFVLRDPADYALLLEELKKTKPELAGWTTEASKETGFALADPLCAAYLESAPDLEEWSAAHELVNRSAQLFLMQRFGVQPYWLQLGTAWAAEWGYDNSLYCFPYRHEFVFATEHGAWPGELKREFGKRAKKPLEMAEFALLKRGSWDPVRARLAFGCASFLALQPADKLALALADLQAFRDENNRVDQDDGTWISDLNYEIPADKQLELLEARLGPKLMERVVAFLGKGNESFKALARP
jgi:hypothetical protein